MKYIKASKQSIQEHNLGLVIKNVIENTEVTRAKISKNTGLARSTISSLVNFLIDNNILFEHEKIYSRVGKKPFLLNFNKNYFYIIAINIGIEDIQVAVTNIFGEKIISFSEKNRPRRNREQILNNLFNTIDKAFNIAKINHTKVPVISVGTHGVVNPKTKIITNAPFLKGWNGIHLIDILKSKFKAEILLEKDVNLGAIGEQWLCYKDISNLIFIDIDFGVGAGVIINNRLISGNTGRMGEIGYFPFGIFSEPQNKIKKLNHDQGIFESQININGIINLVKSKYTEPFNKIRDISIRKNILDDYRYICELYKSINQNPIKNIINKYTVRTIALGISTLIAAIDTEIVIIAGGILNFGNQFLKELIIETSRISNFHLVIKESKLKENAALEGAIKNGIDYLRNKFYYNFFQIIKKNY